MRVIRSAGLRALCLILGACLGCQAPPQPTGPTFERVSVSQKEDFESLWQTAGEALRQHWFRIDREDRASGVLSTHPETSAQGLEFWRQQPRPAYYWTEANLQTIQRKATIQITPVDSQGEYSIDVKVERLRLRLEERQIDNPAAALRLYSAEAPTMSGQMIRPSQQMQWIPLGRDEILEQTILGEILQRFGRPTTVTTAAETAPS
ncbi:MAG: hypothetical protein KA354_09695 [Phycisphaerae bacterium]|nr:hypothetical protein [Phycisphaerae bacterium]